MDKTAAPLRPLIAGNWKMNGRRASLDEVLRLAEKLGGRPPEGTEVLLCPPFTLLLHFRDALAEAGISLGAQDCHWEEDGAHTGDISARQLHDVGARYVILGHSERRQDHGEDSSLIRKKAEAALAAGLVPVICVGETETERDAGKTAEVVVGQLHDSLPEDISHDRLVLAYEPVWAIGSGRTPTGEEIGMVHSTLREALASRLDKPDFVRILYGGSVSAGNAADILGIKNVDGALVGGASLKAEEFYGIIAASRG